MHACVEYVEIFKVNASEANDKDSVFWNSDDDETRGPGWYFWWSMPGCMPDSDAFGPYPTMDEAEKEAVETFCDGECDEESDDETEA